MISKEQPELDPRPCLLSVCPYPKTGYAGTQRAAQGVQPTTVECTHLGPKSGALLSPTNPRDQNVSQSLERGCVPAQQP